MNLNIDPQQQKVKYTNHSTDKMARRSRATKPTTCDEHELRHVDLLQIPTGKCPRTAKRSTNNNWLSKTTQRLRGRVIGRKTPSTDRDSNNGFECQRLRKVPRSEAVLLLDQAEDDWWSGIKKRMGADRRYQRADLCNDCRSAARAAVHWEAVAAVMSLR